LAKNHSRNAGQRMDTSDSVLLVIYPGIVLRMVIQSQHCHLDELFTQDYFRSLLVKLTELAHP